MITKEDIDKAEDLNDETEKITSQTEGTAVSVAVLHNIEQQPYDSLFTALPCDGLFLKSL